jgi:hypothetical protein
MRRAFLGHLVLMLMGYLLAVTVASAVALCAFFLIDSMALTSREQMAGPAPSGLFVVPVLASILAFPMWLLLVIYAESSNETRVSRFAVVGAIAGLLALAFLLIAIEGFNGNSFFSLPGLVLFFSAGLGGFAGGLIYWVIAGQYSGSWKKSFATPISRAHGA